MSGDVEIPGEGNKVFLDYADPEDVLIAAGDQLAQQYGPDSVIVVMFDRDADWVRILNTEHSTAEIIGRLEMAKVELSSQAEG